MSKALEIIRKARKLAESCRLLVPSRLRRLDRETVRALPDAIYTGVAARLHAHATARWCDSGYDARLFPYAWPDDGTQRNYDLYDAWTNRGYEDDSEFWPPRTRRGRLLHGRKVDGKPAVSKEGWDGYSPDPMRLSVWGLNGALHEELAESGTLGTRKMAEKIARVSDGSFKDRNPPDIRGTGYVVDALEAALWAFHRANDFREGALLAVNLGDDADTTGAIYGQIAGAHDGAEAIPAAWRKKLTMVETITSLADNLHDQAALHRE